MFKEFSIEQVFTTKKVYGRPQKTYELGNIPYVTGTRENNGVVGFVSADEKSISKGNCISVDPITGLSCYQPVDFVGRGFSGASINLLYNDNLDEKTALFMCSVIEKVASNVAVYTNLFNSTRLSTAKIKVPVIENPDLDHEYTVNDIDWQYMRDRIQELERDRIQELDAYLQATGLNDYELTMDEEMALRGFFDDSICWKKVNLKDLGFSISHGKRLVKQDRIPGNIPLVTAGEANQGVAEYIGNDWPTYENAITVDMFGNCFLHDGICTGDDNVYFFTSDEWNMKEKEFIVAQINKSLHGKYSYSKQFRQNDADNVCINIPYSADGTINHEYIYIYISSGERNNQGCCPVQREVNEYLQKRRVRFREFLLKDIARLNNGNKFDKNKMTFSNPSVCFVSRTASDNGVSAFVDYNGTKPYKAGYITLAFGGSIGSCFVQDNPFYTGQNVGVIDFGEDVSCEAKQYIATCLGKYCKTVFTAFADEINKHFKKDLSVTLPIKSDGTPDFDYMERYIRAMEKLVIADVVKYKDKIIDITKKVAVVENE